MNEKILRLGLLGKDVSKSPSPAVHTFILKEFGYGCEYEKVSVCMEDFDCVVRRFLGDFDGFNITIPYKRDIMEYLDGIEKEAGEIGAVNTVVCATRTGYNTDARGFMQMLTCAEIKVKGKKTLVLGGGGSGRSSAVALKNAGADVYLYQRNQEKLAETAREIAVKIATADESEQGIYGGSFEILINCTGVGMHDKEGQSPVLAEAFKGAEAAVDLIYTPPESEFLRLAKTQGVKKCVNGASMLFYQAYYADCLFLNREPNPQEAERLYKKYENEVML